MKNLILALSIVVGIVSIGQKVEAKGCHGYYTQESCPEAYDAFDNHIGLDPSVHQRDYIENDSRYVPIKEDVKEESFVPEYSYAFEAFIDSVLGVYTEAHKTDRLDKNYRPYPVYFLTAEIETNHSCPGNAEYTLTQHLNYVDGTSEINKKVFTSGQYNTNVDIEIYVPKEVEGLTTLMLTYNCL